jgi:signal transduction histidine kinase
MGRDNRDGETPMIGNQGMIAQLNRRNRVGVAEHLESKRKAPNPTVLLGELADACVQGIIILGEVNIEFCNDRARELNGVPKSILDEGKPWMPFFEYQMARGDFGEGAEAQVFLDELIANFKARKVMQVERFAGDGRIVRADRIPNSLGGMTLMLTDISDLKAREAELKEISLAAQSAEQAKSDFLASMSHEMRTPLNGILGMAEVLCSSEMSQDQQDAASVIYASAEALVAVVEDVLEVSKIDTGAAPVEVKPLDLSQVIRDLVAEFATAASAKGVGLRVSIAEELPLILGDVRLVRQSASHIIGNALRFTKEGQIDVFLNFEPIDGTKISVTLIVRDTGEGIGTADLHMIFDGTEQVDTLRSRTHDGAGLVLSLARAYAEIMKGRVEVESILGQGSTFKLSVDFELADTSPEK